MFFINVSCLHLCFTYCFMKKTTTRIGCLWHNLYTERNTVNQPKLKANTYRWRKARENACEPVTSDFGFTYDWMTKWRKYSKPLAWHNGCFNFGLKVAKYTLRLAHTKLEKIEDGGFTLKTFSNAYRSHYADWIYKNTTINGHFGFVVEYIWNISYLYCGCRWMWRLIIAVNFPI